MMELIPLHSVTYRYLQGTSMMELNKPTEKISLSQYAALTLTGAIFSRYGLVVTPINYPLTTVNVSVTRHIASNSVTTECASCCLAGRRANGCASPAARCLVLASCYL